METTVGQVQDKVHEHLLITYKRNIQSNQTAEASICLGQVTQFL